MSEARITLRPNDKIEWTIEGAANKMTVEIMNVTKLQKGRVRLDLKALEDARASDGSILVSIGSTISIEVDVPMPDGADFDPVPRSQIAPHVSMGEEQENDASS